MRAFSIFLVLCGSVCFVGAVGFRYRADSHGGNKQLWLHVPGGVDTLFTDFGDDKKNVTESNKEKRRTDNFYATTESYNREDEDNNFAEEEGTEFSEPYSEDEESPFPDDEERYNATEEQFPPVEDNALVELVKGIRDSVNDGRVVDNRGYGKVKAYLFLDPDENNSPRDASESRKPRQYNSPYNTGGGGYSRPRPPPPQQRPPNKIKLDDGYFYPRPDKPFPLPDKKPRTTTQRPTTRRPPPPTTRRPPPPTPRTPPPRTRPTTRRTTTTTTRRPPPPPPTTTRRPPSYPDDVPNEENFGFGQNSEEKQGRPPTTEREPDYAFPPIQTTRRTTTTTKVSILGVLGTETTVRPQSSFLGQIAPEREQLTTRRPEPLARRPEKILCRSRGSVPPRRKPDRFRPRPSRPSRPRPNQGDGFRPRPDGYRPEQGDRNRPPQSRPDRFRPEGPRTKPNRPDQGRDRPNRPPQGYRPRPPQQRPDRYQPTQEPDGYNRPRPNRPRPSQDRYQPSQGNRNRPRPRPSRPKFEDLPYCPDRPDERYKPVGQTNGNNKPGRRPSGNQSSFGQGIPPKNPYDGSRRPDPDRSTSRPGGRNPNQGGNPYGAPSRAQEQGAPQNPNFFNSNVIYPSFGEENAGTRGTNNKDARECGNDGTDETFNHRLGKCINRNAARRS